MTIQRALDEAFTAVSPEAARYCFYNCFGR